MSLGHLDSSCIEQGPHTGKRGAKALTLLITLSNMYIAAIGKVGLK